MTTMQDIQKQAQEYSEARTELADRVKLLQSMKDALDRKHMPGITKALLALVAAKDVLKELINSARELFEKPKTQIFSSVRVGLQKGKGKLVWDDEEKVLAKIYKNYSDDQASSLIRTEEHPDKDALALLPADELKKLGIRIEGDGDQVVIKDMESDIEKIIKALMKSEEEKCAEKAA